MITKSISFFVVTLLTLPSLTLAANRQQEDVANESAANTTNNKVTVDEESERLLRKAEDAGEAALESGEGILKQIDENEQIRESAEMGLTEIEKLKEQQSPWWFFAIMTISAATTISFSIQTLGGFLTLFRYGYLDIREMLADFLSTVVSIICLSFVVSLGDRFGAITGSNVALIGMLLLAAILGIAMGAWGVKQELASCRTAKLMEELSETKSNYKKLKAKAKRMSEVGLRLVEEKKMRAQQARRSTVVD